MAEFRRKKKKICQMCGACAKHQRHIAEQIKYARLMALIPFVK